MYSRRQKSQLGMAVRACNDSTQEAGAAGTQVRDQPGLYSETLHRGAKKEKQVDFSLSMSSPHTTALAITPSTKGNKRLSVKENVNREALKQRANTYMEPVLRPDNLSLHTVVIYGGLACEDITSTYKTLKSNISQA